MWRSTLNAVSRFWILRTWTFERRRRSKRAPCFRPVMCNPASFARMWSKSLCSAAKTPYGADEHIRGKRGQGRRQNPYGRDP
eukprot:15367034-Alexandrium_andersonii.AAC.1